MIAWLGIASIALEVAEALAVEEHESDRTGLSIALSMAAPLTSSQVVGHGLVVGTGRRADTDRWS